MKDDPLGKFHHPMVYKAKFYNKDKFTATKKVLLKKYNVCFVAIYLS